MGVRLKFNLVLVLVFALGLGVSGVLSRRILEANARDEVVRNADLMMGAALAVRSYTNSQITPQLELQLMRTFLPQSIPAYAATETFNALRAQHPEYSYKEAVLNPTNPRDKALEWETDIISQFRNEPELKDFRGSRETATGKTLYLARPIRISDPGCLRCHSTPDAAPASMVKLYGQVNGFGWQRGETVGAQIVSVPMTVALDKADQAFRTFMASLLAVFVVAFVVLNAALSLLIVRPIIRMAGAADQVSTGSLAVPEFVVKGRDEIATLATAFNRLRRSLEKAMHLLE
jgi:HAMP domain-containing protein